MQLSISKIFSNSVSVVLKNGQFFFIIGSVYFLINTLVQIYIEMYEIENFWLGLFFILLSLALYVKPAVMTHRVVILDSEKKWANLFKWRSFEMMFLMISMGLYLALMVFTFLIVFVVFLFVSSDSTVLEFTSGWVFEMLFLLLIAIAFCQFSLIFPATAIGKPMEIEDSIGLTNPHLLKLFVLLALPPVLNALIAEFVFIEGSVVGLVLSNFIYYCLLFFEIAILSHVYMALTGHQNNDREVKPEVEI